jgi:glycosyltransferase involved in cell wall biosynthesis
MSSSPAKVLRILTRLNIGGPAIHALLLSTKLAPQRFPTCLVVGEPDATEGEVTELVQGDQKGEGEAGSNLLKLIRVKTLCRHIRPLADLRSLICLLRIVWKERPQLLHTHMAKAGALGRLAGILYNRFGPGRTTGKRAVLIHTFHGHVLDGYFSPWLAQLFVRIERWLARRTDCLIAVSQTIQRELCDKGIGRQDQWRVIPVGVDLSALAQLPVPNGSSPVRFGLVGRLVPIKNPSLFLQAFHRMRHQQSTDPSYGVVVGDGPLRDTVARQVRELGLERVVRLTGWQRDVHSIYGELEVACLTSWNEGTPVALIEAMAASRAVVATRVGGVRDLLETGVSPSTPIPWGEFRMTDRGVLVSPGDVEGLAKAMVRLGQDAALRRRLGEAARTYVVGRYSQERLLKDVTALYEELLGAGASP